MKPLARLLTPFLLIAGLAAVVPAPVKAQAPAASSSSELLRPEQLDQIVAPIALYPDPLLAEVLMAATYPLEVVSADRWATQHKDLKGEQLKTEAQKQGWDESVSSLTATPDVLNMMSTQLEWTQSLGDAVLAQQPDVMDAIQRLRNKAYADKKLTTSPQQKVSVTQQQGKDVVVVEPATPDTIYVPYYDPAVVYGAWPYPAYPPFYFGSPGYIAGGLIATGIAFGAGYAVGRWASGGNYWGGGVNWGGNSINVNRPINIDNTKINNFNHNPEHRHGVRYSNNSVNQKFGNRTNAAADRHNDFRGRDGQQVLRPGGDRPGGDNRPNAGDRPGGGDRPDAGNRPSGKDRPQGGNRPDTRPAKPGGSAGNVSRGNGGDAFANVSRGGGEIRAQANRGKASLGGGGGGGGGRAAAAHGGGGGGRAAAAGGGGRGGGGGGRGRR